MLTAGGLDRLDLYRRLAMREVWLWTESGVETYARSQDGDYEEVREGSFDSRALRGYGNEVCRSGPAAAGCAGVPSRNHRMTSPRRQIGFLVYPSMTQLDMAGPAQVFTALPQTDVHYVWKSMEPVPTDARFSVLPTATFADCPQLNVVCVPGGPGQMALMSDEVVHAFLRRQAEGARYVTSVCTGSLVLAAAGLLKGRKAACHWAFRDQLAAFGAEAQNDRVVRDDKFFTGGGVTAGIDFGLRLAAALAGDEVAQKIQLALEYDPQPPFSGNPSDVDAELAAAVKRRLTA